MSKNPDLICVEELHQRLNDKTLKILDGSWYLPDHNRDPIAEYFAAHIPNAQFFDIDKIADQNSNLPHTLLSPEAFEKAASELGISNEDEVIVYDGMGLFSAARVWWNFTVMGAKARILDGGMPAWKAAKLPLESGEVHLPKADFKANFDENSVVSSDEVFWAIENQTSEILDARPHPRFTGEAKEPRSGVASGHMPSAKNLPFMNLTHEGRLLPPSKLLEQFSALDFDHSKPTITSCGSGVTAAMLALALKTIGKEDYQLYDGSWAQWGTLEGAPIEKGE